MEDNELRLLAYKQRLVETMDQYEAQVIDLRVALTQSEQSRYELLEKLQKYEGMAEPADPDPEPEPVEAEKRTRTRKAS